MKKAYEITKLIFIIIAGLMASIFIGSAMIAGIYEGITGKTLGDSVDTTAPPIPETSLSIPETSSPITEALTDQNVCVKQVAPVELVVIEYEQDWVGGNSVLITAINKTDKTISWIQYDLYFLNVKGDILLDNIRNWSKISVYHGPIKPYGRIEIKNPELFYNYSFNGRYAIDNIIIHYDDGYEEIITLQDFNNYEPFIFDTGDNLVVCGKHHPFYHIEGCSKLERNRNLCDLIITIKEAKSLGIVRCPECLPY